MSLKEVHETLAKKIEEDLTTRPEYAPKQFEPTTPPLNRVIVERINADKPPTPDNLIVTLNDLNLPGVKSLAYNADVDQPLTTVTLTLYANVEIR